MSLIAAALKHMMAAGMLPDAIVAAVAEMEATINPGPTKRQARNARYYEDNKDALRLKSTERRLNALKTTELKPPILAPKDNIQTPEPTPKEGEATPPSRDRPKSELAQAVEIFNFIAGRAGWPKVDKLTEARKGKLRARLKDAGGLTGWIGLIERAAKSNFMLGDNDKGWKPDFDFFLSEEKFTKLMEGSYDNRTQNRSSDRGNGIGPAIERLHARIDGGRNHGAVVLDDELPLDAGRGMPGFARRFS